jgi:hypothetical protein
MPYVAAALFEKSRITDCLERRSIVSEAPRQYPLSAPFEAWSIDLLDGNDDAVEQIGSGHFARRREDLSGRAG